MEVKITKDHIRKGVQFSRKSCPIAIAVHEKIKNSFVRVDAKIITINTVLYEPYAYVKNWIINFDNGRKVSPFTISFDKIKKIARKKQELKA